MKLTTVILTKNNESILNIVIDSVSFSDEIIIVDSGSTDKTLEIAKSFTTQIYTRDLTNFADQRNFAISKAKGEWVLYIDADEIVSKKLQEDVLQIVTQKSPSAAFKIRRINYYFEFAKWPKEEYLERLFQKSKFKKWTGEIHETSTFDGKLEILHSEIFHFTHSNLSSMVDKTNQYSDYESKLLFESKHPKMKPWRFLRIMGTKFFDSYFYQGGWKIGFAGLLESMYQSYSYFIVYAKLWEKQLKK